MRLLKSLLVLLLLSGPLLAIWRGWLDVPAHWNPWAPLDLRLPPNLLTPVKRWQLQHDPALCAQALATSTLRYTTLPDSAPSAACPLVNSVRIQSSAVALSNSFIASCPLAVGFALFQQHGLQPAAQAIFGQPVTRIEHYGSFACRNIAGGSGRSQHASANALDITGFHLQDGRLISLARDWQGAGEAADFLREVQAGACKAFNTTLGPDYNSAHHDHFHVDMGPSRLCR